MCGIAGYFSNEPNNSASALIAMASSIKHRGPDDGGFVFVNTRINKYETYSSLDSPPEVAEHFPQLTTNASIGSHEIALAHVRYSIIDLSSSGHQPMWSRCGQACITFNGEIYNYIELRNKLIQQGYVFSSKSDTEVFLAAYLAWGEGVFSRLNGFFAVAIYDARKKAVLLARDRLGVANMYFSRDSGHGFLWASEIKALRAAGCVNDNAIDVSAIKDFIVLGRRDRGGTFWHGVEDFPTGHFVWLKNKGGWEPQCYWNLPSSRWRKSDISIEQSVTGLADVLTGSLEVRLRSDLPIAFELSGGMDSSALVGLAAGRLGKSFTTCTIEFPQEHSNEEPFARLVAQHYPKKIDYRIIKPPMEHFWEEANDFVWLQEEPFHAPNLHTNQVLRRMFKNEGIGVVITGAAGDEMLAGYSSDYLGPYLRYLFAKGSIVKVYHELVKNSEIPAHKSLVSLILDVLMLEERRSIFCKWRTKEYQLLKKVLSKSVLVAHFRFPSDRKGTSFHGRTVNNMTHRLMNYWLRSGSKSDYGIPIEARAPFLDYKVVEYCCQLPPEYLIHDGWHKYALRKAVEDYLPKEVVWRRQKMGFPFPYREWLFANKKVIFKNVQSVDCPYIDINRLFQHYDDFMKIAPLTLWRLISVVLWWRRVIRGHEIYAS